MMGHKMNVLILGGTGYIGGKITHRLVKDGHTVVCCRRTTSPLDGLEDIKDKIKFIRATEDAVEAISWYIDFDLVLNVASNYGRSDVLYGDVIEANIEFPLKIMNRLVEIKCGKINNLKNIHNCENRGVIFAL
jgi:CDP-paratose synthetase